MQAGQREARVQAFTVFCASLSRNREGDRIQETLFQFASQMHLDVRRFRGTLDPSVCCGASATGTRAARDKRIAYDEAQRPAGSEEEYSSAEIVTGAMKVSPATRSGFHRFRPRFHQRVDRHRRRRPERALNVGVAEANMMGIGRPSPRWF
jgi:hypothetical protein